MVRGSLPERILLKPNGSGQSYPKTLTKEWLARTIEKDPSEAVDAGATLGAIRDVFPMLSSVRLAACYFSSR